VRIASAAPAAAVPDTPDTETVADADTATDPTAAVPDTPDTETVADADTATDPTAAVAATTETVADTGTETDPTAAVAATPDTAATPVAGAASPAIGALARGNIPSMRYPLPVPTLSEYP